MFGIHFLSDRQNDHADETMTYPGNKLDGAERKARSLFVDVQRRHPKVIGFRILDNSKTEIRRWFASDEPHA
jgi:hypothetical protein